MAPEFELDTAGRRVLSRARIGMLALHGAEHPLVNPAVYQYAAGSVWMTTSRHAVKVSMLRKDPRASFLVTGSDRALLLQGLAEVYDPLTLSGQVRAALEAPTFYPSLARYGLKNLNFVAGYLLDLARIPRQWWPQNRVAIRLRPERGRAEACPTWPASNPAHVPELPAAIRRSLGGQPVAYLCWSRGGSLLLEPCMWAGDAHSVVVALGERGLRGPAGPAPAALVIEYHHQYRATRMAGACVRGTLERVDHPAELTRRYGVEGEELGSTFRLRPERVTWWRGFEVNTSKISQPAERTA